MLERSQMEQHIRDTKKMLATLDADYAAKVTSENYYAHVLADQLMMDATKLAFIRLHYVNVNRIKNTLTKTQIEFKKTSSAQLYEVACAKVVWLFTVQFKEHPENLALEILARNKYEEALQHFTVEGMIQGLALKAAIKTATSQHVNVVSKPVSPVQAVAGSIVKVTATPVSKPVVAKPKPVPNPALKLKPVKTKRGIITPLPSTFHALEAITANREFRTLVAMVDIQFTEFDEAAIRETCTRNGVTDYRGMCSMIRHLHSNYDKLRLSRKIRRNNTYWKITAHPAVRIALCERMILLVRDPYIHALLLESIEKSYALVQADIHAAATSPNFVEAMDGIYRQTVGTKLQNVGNGRLEFVLGLQTL